MKTTIPTLFTMPLLFFSFVSAVNLDCSHIRVDKKKFDFSKIGGPHSVMVHDESHPPAMYNTTYTIDICRSLGRDKDILKQDQCPGGTRVCGIVKSYNPGDDPDRIQVENVIPIAGDYSTSNSGRLDPQYTRLKSQDSNTEGLQIELNGGSYANKKQKAIIEFQCDKGRTGNEGNEDALDDEKRSTKRADDEKDVVNNTNSLSFVSYGSVEGKENLDVLRLNWRTKYACEDFEEDDDDNKNGKKAGWGVFTWFILIAFLAIAAYLIFGSWLNYNRYGARGWDLLPHGDTIRDIPYLFKDWSKKVIGTVSGGGTRGGYSAV